MNWQLKRRVHISWHIAWFSGGVIAGIALASLVPPEWFLSFAWVIVALSFLCLVLVRPYAWLVSLTFLSGVLLGLWRGTLEQSDFSRYWPYLNSVTILKGRIEEDGVIKMHNEQRVYLHDVSIGGKNLAGSVWVSTSAEVALKREDSVEFRGRLGAGFAGSPAAMFRAQIVKIERPKTQSIAVQTRDIFSLAIKAHISEPQASLGLGFLVGQQGSLPETLNEQLKSVGLTHIIVASGYNLTILVVLARRLFEKVSKYLAVTSASILIVGFSAVTGMSPSMFRAGLVTSLSLAAWYYGRQIHPIVLLAFVGAITACVNPAYIWGDIGWYLSFLAFMGVLVFAPLLQAYFWQEDKEPSFFAELLIGTIAAQIMTLPLLLAVFGQLAIYALPANILILPLVPLAMLFTFVGGLGALLAPALTPWFVLPAQLLLQLITNLVGWIATWPNAQIELQFPLYALVISYSTIFGVLLWLKYKTSYSFVGSKQNKILF